MEDNYSVIIGDMTWSYSRLKLFEQCRYGWLLKYIYECEDVPKFFTQYGKYIHTILEKFYKGALDKSQLSTYYIINYYKNVTGRPPNSKIGSSYFMQGLDLFNNYYGDNDCVVDVERKVGFKIGDRNFVGYVDLIKDKGDTVEIIDHKSRNLKPYSKRKKSTKNDALLDDYFRQLYLYSIPIAEKSGKNTVFYLNSFRNQSLIKTEFYSHKLDETKRWALNTIQYIENNTDWSPNVDDFYCKYICGLSKSCEYFNI